jgi:hypothetical protein
MWNYPTMTDGLLGFSKSENEIVRRSGNPVVSGGSHGQFDNVRRRFDANQLWSEALEIDRLQNVVIDTLNVDRNEVDAIGEMLGQNIVCWS